MTGAPVTLPSCGQVAAYVEDSMGDWAEAGCKGVVFRDNHLHRSQWRELLKLQTACSLGILESYIDELFRV